MRAKIYITFQDQSTSTKLMLADKEFTDQTDYNFFRVRFLDRLKIAYGWTEQIKRHHTGKYWTIACPRWVDEHVGSFPKTDPYFIFGIGRQHIKDLDILTADKVCLDVDGVVIAAYNLPIATSYDLVALIEGHPDAKIHLWKQDGITDDNNVDELFYGWLQHNCRMSSQFTAKVLDTHTVMGEEITNIRIDELIFHTLVLPGHTPYVTGWDGKEGEIVKVKEVGVLVSKYGHLEKIESIQLLKDPNG